ncbi:phosphoribosyltransferase [Vibrio mediterranei]|uniref:phosphoribosyltransferase n=1 Tax=Vibrio mediterranei TaxID=689 RepID=UPI001C0F255D|nr:phosphoribosyltransferase [Vibrio mediterranei]
MSKLGIGERAPWHNFPKVVRNGDLGSLKNEPEYEAAKSGDILAAIVLVDRLITEPFVDGVREIIGSHRPLILPVLAVEAAGNNKIPLAMAEVLSDRIGLDIELGIVQNEKVGRTGAGADHRLAFNPTFDGIVRQGEYYLIIDDTLAMGGTLASLRGYVENRGGKVLAASVMTAHEGVLSLPVKATMVAGIESKHGPSMNQFWQETFGYGIDKLTQGEAGHLKSAKTVDAIRKRIIEARHEGVKCFGKGRVEASSSPKSSTLKNKGFDAKFVIDYCWDSSVNKLSVSVNGDSPEKIDKTILERIVQKDPFLKHYSVDEVRSGLLERAKGGSTQPVPKAYDTSANVIDSAVENPRDFRMR